MSNNSGGTSTGLGLPSVLFVVFLVLKLLNKIDWSWWWVTSPLWISAGVGLLIIVPLVIWLAVTDK